MIIFTQLIESGCDVIHIKKIEINLGVVRMEKCSKILDQGLIHIDFSVEPLDFYALWAGTKVQIFEYWNFPEISSVQHWMPEDPLLMHQHCLNMIKSLKKINHPLYCGLIYAQFWDFNLQIPSMTLKWRPKQKGTKCSIHILQLIFKKL